MLGDIVDCHISDVINKDISNNKFSKNASIAIVRPIFKKGNRTKIKKLQAC